MVNDSKLLLHPINFFNFSESKYSDLFEDIDYVWDVIKRLPNYIDAKLKPERHKNSEISPLSYVDENVYIGSGTIIEPGAVIKGPTIIGDNCKVRSRAYIRENVIVGNNVTIGHAIELKNCFTFDEVELPHFSYVGDSILGFKSHLGAGAKISNFKINRQPITVKIGKQRYETGLIKFGAVLGDEVEIGCNSVLNPGTLIGKRTLAYANLSLYGYYSADLIIKLRQSYEIVERTFNK